MLFRQQWVTRGYILINKGTFCQSSQKMCWKMISRKEREPCFVGASMRSTTQFNQRVIYCLSYSAMDIKELKFLDIQNTVNKPSCAQGAATEPVSVPSGRPAQSNRTAQSHATSSSSSSTSAPITILRRGRYRTHLWCIHPHS